MMASDPLPIRLKDGFDLRQALQKRDAQQGHDVSSVSWMLRALEELAEAEGSHLWRHQTRAADARSGGGVSQHHRRAGRRLRAGRHARLHQRRSRQEATALSASPSKTLTHSSTVAARRKSTCLSTRGRTRRSITSTSKLNGHRFYGSTGRTTRKEAEAVEAVERDKAKALMKAMQRSRTSLLIDDVAARLWDAERAARRRAGCHIEPTSHG